MIAGTCQICGCTDDRACEGGCGWADDDHTICTVCFLAGEVAEQVVTVFAQLGPRMRPPAPLASPVWTDLTFEQQQLLIMALRRVAEALRDTMLEELTLEAVDAMNGVRLIRQFLAQHCPQHLHEDEPLEAVVVRLLEPHVGSRIVLPGSAVRL